MTSDLAAAILALKEMYERESAATTARNNPVEGRRASPRQPAGFAEAERDPIRALADDARARTRIARALAALATEHDKRSIAEAELHRLRAEFEQAREQLRDALHQLQGSQQRTEQAEANVIRLRGASVRRSVLLSGTALALILALSGWRLRLSTEPARNGLDFVVAEMQRGWDAAKQQIHPKSAPLRAPATERSEATALPQSPAPAPDAGQSLQLAAGPIQAETGQGQIPAQAAADPSAQPGSGDASQAIPAPPGEQQQPAVAATAQQGSPEAKLAATTPGSEPTDAVQEPRQDNVEAQQSEPAPLDVARTLSPASTTSTDAAADRTVPNGNPVTAVAVAHVSIHYEQSSTSARTEAQRVAALLARSGLRGSQLASTEHVLSKPVVR